MAAQPEDCDLGPLPRATREHELEQLGINALRAALPTDRFLFRDERVDDQGVDGSLEICMAGRYTNFRSQVQLKSTDSAATNSDGSISLQVKASNLNYLLSGTSPIYVLYVVPRNDLRYVWAFDELTRLDRDNPTWRDQETVTLRLARPLDGDAIEEMHERICREARSNRHIREILGRATIGEQVLIGVDVASLEVSDPDEVYQFLSTSGMTAVSAGYGKHILEHVHLLTLRRRQEPRMRLLCAYAQHTMGKYVAALGHLQEIMPLKGQLTEYDQQFFQSLCNACEFQIGRITRAEYDQRDAALTEAASGMFLLERQVHKLKREILSEQDPATVRSLLDAFQQMVGSLLSRDDVNQAFKIHAQIELLEAKGSRLVDEYMTAAAIKAMQADLGSLCDTAQSVERADAVRGLMIEWVETCNELIQAARALKHPTLFADALVVSVLVQVALLEQRRILTGAADLPESMANTLVEQIEKAVEMFAFAGALERELRARILRADLHESVGEFEEARRIANEVLPKAQAMNYAKITAHAERHLAGESIWKTT